MRRSVETVKVGHDRSMEKDGKSSIVLALCCKRTWAYQPLVAVAVAVAVAGEVSQPFRWDQAGRAWSSLAVRCLPFHLAGFPQKDAKNSRFHTQGARTPMVPALRLRHG